MSLNIQGFRLIDYIEDVSATYIGCPFGMVEYSPDRKYQFEKVNPVDPTEVWRLGKYYIDTFNCEVVPNPGEYDTLKSFLDNSTELYIEYDHDGSTVQFPVIIKKMPKCPDEMHEYRAKTKFTLEARYETMPSPIDFDDIVVCSTIIFGS